MVETSSPRVTIGVPVYNGANFLVEALDSILGQTFHDMEVVISDNGSTDETKAICEDYIGRDQRVRYYRSDVNRGATWNYNLVFAKARGTYFKWAAHDDKLAPDYIEKCVEVLDGEPSVVLCYPKTRIIDECSRPVRDYEDHFHLRSHDANRRFESLLFRPTGECNAVFGLMRRSVLASTPCIRSYVGSDLVLLSELALRGQVHEIPEYLFWRRDHPMTTLRVYGDTPTESAAWFDPSLKLDVHLWHWRWAYDFFTSVFRVPLRMSERVRSLLTLGRWVRWQRAKMADELLLACKFAGARVLPFKLVGTRKS